MTETMNTPAAPCGKIFAALAKAQASFGTIQKKHSYRLGSGPAIKYADLSAVYAATLPALGANGIAVTHRTYSDDRGVTVETILGHESGETLSSGPFFVPASGGNNKAQAYGSARTYACRYSLCSVLAVAADDDDDGSAVGCGSAAERHAPQQQRFTLTQEHVDQAHGVAAQGTDAYKAYFAALPVEHRKALIDSGWHEALKRDAQAADQGGTQA